MKSPDETIGSASPAPWNPVGEPEKLADLWIGPLFKETVEDPNNGHVMDIARIESVSGALAILETPELNYVLILQWRHGTRQYNWELPGGMVDPGESALEGGVREAIEESGYTSAHAPTLLQSHHPMGGFTNETSSTLYLQNVQQTQPTAHSPGEGIGAIIEVPFSTLLHMAQRGQHAGYCMDGMSVGAVHALHTHLYQQGMLHARMQANAALEEGAFDFVI